MGVAGAGLDSLTERDSKSISPRIEDVKLEEAVAGTEIGPDGIARSGSTDSVCAATGKPRGQKTDGEGTDEAGADGMDDVESADVSDSGGAGASGSEGPGKL